MDRSEESMIGASSAAQAFVFQGKCGDAVGTTALDKVRECCIFGLPG